MHRLFGLIGQGCRVIAILFANSPNAPFHAGGFVEDNVILFLYDWSQVDSVGPRLENMVASHLLKYCHFVEDVHGHRMELRFLRDTDKREVDFVVIKDRKPMFAVECKHGESAASPHLYYFRERTSIPHFYQVHLGKSHRQLDDRISIIPFVDFCRVVGLV